MELAFSDDDEAMRGEFARALASSGVRRGLQYIETQARPYDEPLWRQLAQNGWLGAAIDAGHGGSALPPSTLCAFAEEAGRQLVAIPFVASACAFSTALQRSGHAAAQAQWLPRLADGSAIGALAMPTPTLHASGDGDARHVDGEIAKLADGAALQLLMTMLGDGDAAQLLLIDVRGAEVRPSSSAALDPLHPPAGLRLNGAPATVLAAGAHAGKLWRDALDRAALFHAFEQLGGAEACLHQARDYSRQRYAFGRPIGSFQALKHAMADMLTAVELARSNCWFGAAALNDGDEAAIGEAAAVARLAATEAFRLCARQSLQIHGGIGMTWEADAHLYYRRAQMLGSALGDPARWSDRLVELLRSRHPHGISIAPPALLDA